MPVDPNFSSKLSESVEEKYSSFIQEIYELYYHASLFYNGTKPREHHSPRNSKDGMYNEF